MLEEQPHSSTSSSTFSLSLFSPFFNFFLNFSVKDPNPMVGSSPNPSSTIKFLCSYGGKILPRHPDAKLRYHGGETRILSVHRSISFSELSGKLGEMCGATVIVRCQLPTEDLDALVSITSDEDLANVIEEYDRTPSGQKIRAFLSLPKSTHKVSPSSSIASSSADAASPKSPSSPSRNPTTPRCVRQTPPPGAYPMCSEKSAGKRPQCAAAFHARHIYLIHNGNHWQ